MPEGGSGTTMEISKLVLKLETNFQQVLKQQVGAFDKFTRDANALTRQVGSNMNQLAKTTSTTFSTIYRGNRKEVQELVATTRSALQGVRKEVLRMNALQDKMSQGMVSRQRAMRQKLMQAMKINASSMSPDMKQKFVKSTMAAYNQLKIEHDKYVNYVQKRSETVLVKYMANAVNAALQQIVKGSRQAAVTVNNVSNQMQAAFNKIWRRRGIMPQSDLVEQGAAMLNQRQANINQLDKMLSAHEKKQVQAERHLAKQKELLSQQTNKTLIQHQEMMVAQATAAVRKLGMEYEFMYNKINKMKSGQISQTELFRKQAEQGVAAIKQVLRGANLARDTKAMWDNLTVIARNAGHTSGEAFAKAVDRGKKLDSALINKKKHLEDLLATARKLHASGLIDTSREITRLKGLINEIKVFRGEFLKAKKDITNIPQVSMVKFSKGGLEQARKLAFEIRNATAAMRSLGPVSEDNITQVRSALTRIESLHKQHSAKIMQIRKTMDTIRTQMRKARMMEMLSDNETVAAAWRTHYQKLKAIHTQFIISLKQQKLPTKPFEEYEGNILAVIHRIRMQAKSNMLPVESIRRDAGIMKDEFIKVGQKMDALSQKRLIKPEHLAEGHAYIAKLKSKVDTYNETIRNLNVQLERLRRLQRQGLGGEGMSQQMTAMKSQMLQLQQQVRQYEKMQVQMHKRMAAAQRQSLKRAATSGWEVIRNFRWQVASIIYLVTRAVWFVNRTIIKMLDQIGEYRKSAFSIAAAIAFQMTENSQKAFDRAYSYARKLMNQLEMVAAETILSLEDMLMLTKTFAQAGIVPKTEKDVRRIATIGTAIKALTEGMANAGVQMRQELYAVIQGRQRATDQLAKMFQVMGINIQQLIDDGKKEGKDMITVLSDALAPFAEMNSRLKNEWEQVKNRIGVVWKLIQRIGGEDFLVSWSKELNKFLDTFVTKTEDGFYQLTERGAMWASWITATLNIFKAIYDVIVAIVGVVEGMLLQISGIVGAVNDLFLGMMGMHEEAARTKSQWDGLIILLQVFVQGLNVVGQLLLGIAALVKSIAIVFNTWIKRITVAAGAMEALLAGDFGGVGAYWDSFVETGEKADKELTDIWMGEGGFFRSAWRGLDSVNKQFEEMRRKADGTYEKLGDVGDLFKLPNNAAMLMEKAGKLAPQLKQLTLAGLEGPEKFAKEKEFSLMEPKEFQKQLNENLGKLRYIVEGAIKKKFEVDPDKLTFYTNLLKGHEKTLGDLDKITAAATAKELKQLKDWHEARAREMAGWKKGYEDLWNSLTPKDDTRAKKTESWLKDMNAKLEELRVKNPLVRKEFEKFQNQLQVAFGERQQADVKAINEEMEKMRLKLTSHRPVDAISKINDEFAKMKLSIVTNKEFIDRGLVPEMLKLWEVTKRERIEVEKLSMAYKASGAELEVMSMKAAYLTGSYSPAKRMQGEIRQIKIDHQKAMEGMQKEIDTTYKLWIENGQWATREGSAEAKRHVVALQEQMQELTRVTERELKKKQQPIWNDLVEASNSWADGFTDALSNIVDGVGSVQEALNELQNQILKDVVKTVIKRSITDQLQSALGSGEDSPMSGFFGLFPGGKKETGKGATEITAKKPIPVTIYNPQDLMDSTFKSFEPMEKMSMADVEVGFGQKVFVTNWPTELYNIVGGGSMSTIGKGAKGISDVVGVSKEVSKGIGEIASQGIQGVSQDLADISSEISENTEKAKENSKSWYSNLTDSLSGLGSKIAGMFSGGGEGGGSDWGSWLSTGMKAASMFMADGGVISEPIVGKGLESGTTYNFGERSKYGENEIVAPIKKLQSGGSRNEVQYHMPIHLSAIDTQSGVQFLMKHGDVIQGQLARNLKKNKPIRKGIQNAF